MKYALLLLLISGKTDVFKQITTPFTDDWSAEKWIAFEQQCKDNL